jgi:hypothetical protein
MPSRTLTVDRQDVFTARAKGSLRLDTVRQRVVVFFLRQFTIRGHLPRRKAQTFWSVRRIPLNALTVERQNIFTVRQAPSKEHILAAEQGVNLGVFGKQRERRVNFEVPDKIVAN